MEMYGHNVIESCCVCMLLHVVKCISAKAAYINLYKTCLCKCRARCTKPIVVTFPFDVLSCSPFFSITLFC